MINRITLLSLVAGVTFAYGQGDAPNKLMKEIYKDRRANKDQVEVVYYDTWKVEYKVTFERLYNAAYSGLSMPRYKTKKRVSRIYWIYKPNGKMWVSTFNSKGKISVTSRSNQEELDKFKHYRWNKSLRYPR